jgi:hypothetical protein
MININYHQKMFYIIIGTQDEQRYSVHGVFSDKTKAINEFQAYCRKIQEAVEETQDESGDIINIEMLYIYSVEQINWLKEVSDDKDCILSTIQHKCENPEEYPPEEQFSLLLPPFEPIRSFDY